MAAENSDTFWEESDVKGYNFTFDDEESVGDQMCGVSLQGTARLSQQIRAGMRGVEADLSLDALLGSSASSTISDSGTSMPYFELHNLISERSLDCILDADLVDLGLVEKQVSPEEEIRILRRQIENRWSPPDIGITLKRILLGRPYSLELYRSLSDKKALLSAAIGMGDGDAILVVTLFLVRTLKKSMFYQIMAESPIAVAHYANYLGTRMQIPELTDMLEMLGRSREASMKQFELACQNPQRQLQRLHLIMKNHFSNGKDKMHVENFIKLLEWQMEVGLERQQPVLASLAILCRQHWADPKGSARSPLTLTHQQGIGDKQFQWTALSELAQLQRWDDVNTLFITKNWLGGRRVKAVLPMEEVVLQLHKHDAPSGVLMEYLALVEPVERRLNIARRLHCHKAVIDALTIQRDRQTLVSYKANIHSQSEDYFYAENVLRSAVKWKN